MSSQLWPLQVFDPSADFAVAERRLPHWSQAGTICFITWRTLDSIPRAVAERWVRDRAIWLHRHGIEVEDLDWRNKVLEMAPPLRSEFLQTFSSRWHDQLDKCQGECVLREPTLSKIVADSLLKFDGAKYEMIDFVIMPNHVHLIAAFFDESEMLRQCLSWKHFTASQVHKALGRKDKFWQQDGFDHLIRSESQFVALRKYIADNGAKANLQSHEYRHYSKDLSLPK